mgnify:FL=1
MPTSVKSGTATRRILSDVYVWTGVILFAFAAGAACLAMSFDPTSRTFPLVVSIIMMIAGGGIFLQALSSHEHRPLPLHEFGTIGLAVIAIVLWGLGLAFGLGFLLSTIALMMAMLWLSGLRTPLRALVISSVIAAVAYGLFVMVLNVHLPSSFLSFIAPGL